MDTVVQLHNVQICSALKIFLSVARGVFEKLRPFNRSVFKLNTNNLITLFTDYL